MKEDGVNLNTGGLMQPRTLVTLFFALFAGAYGQDCSIPATSYQQGVVSLTVKKTKKETGQVTAGSGTGFVVSPQGYVLTADHVVARDSSVDDISINGAIGSLYAPNAVLTVVGEDKRSDVALLRFLDQSRRYTAIRLGNAFDVSLGAPLCSLGFSAPLSADYRTTTGILSSLTGQDDANGVENLWTTQLPSNLGESGAPVLHLPDKGVVAIKYGGERPGTAQNVNYVIPLNLAGTLLWQYCGIILPHPTYAVSASFRLEKLSEDQPVIPVGGWDNFKVRVLDKAGKPVPGAKVAWRTPVGGPLLYVSQSDQAGVASAPNLYTFPTSGDYLQTAAVVSDSTPTGFTDPAKILASGPAIELKFKQQ